MRGIFRFNSRRYTLSPVIVAIAFGTLAPGAEWKWFHCFTAPSGQVALMTWKKVGASVAPTNERQRLIDLALLP